MIASTVAVLLISILIPAVSWAQEESAPQTEAPIETQPQSQPVVKKPQPKPAGSKGRRVREKETEGTEAADRFQADTVIKSRYHFNGQPLEVDPD